MSILSFWNRDHVPASALRIDFLRTRRLLLIVPSLVAALVVTGLSVATLAGGAHSILDGALAFLFVAVMAWECLVVWQLVLGFFVWTVGPYLQSTIEQDACKLEPTPTGQSRSAILIPIFEENVDEVFARVKVIWASLARLGETDDVVVHVLSDTQTPQVAAAEERHASALQSRDMPTLQYRRRECNAGRKAGNLGEFLERAGCEYDFAIVLDADSLMSGTAVRRLIRLMERHADVALIQTVSYAAGRETLFARIQQFAVRLYAPLALRGLEFWQGGEGSYWGHNAILRIAPFQQHCKLPILPGRPPFGGEILCHDTVEAALLVRAGWEVRLLPDTDGTWEEMPTNASDLLNREQRWCQGNLQHSRLLGLPGLRSGSRTHIVFGIVGYLVAPLWWAFLLLGAVRVLVGDPVQGLGLLAYGLTESGPASMSLAVVAGALIAAPRVLNLWRALCDRDERRNFGGARRLLTSAALEQVFSLLFGPSIAMANSISVLRTLGGRVVRWDSQFRGDRRIGAVQAAALHWPHLIVALILAAACIKASGWYAGWMAVPTLSLLLSPWMTSLSSRVDLGRWSRQRGLFLTVDDVSPAQELLEFQNALTGLQGNR